MASNDDGKILHRDPVVQRGFTQTENIVLTDTRLSVGARFLYTLLKMHAWQADNAFPGQARLGEIMGIKERMVRMYLAELYRYGHITKEQRGLTQTNRYYIEPLHVVYADCLSERQYITGQERHDIASQERQSIADKENAAVKKTQQKKTQLESAPAPVDIPTVAPIVTAPRDMPTTGRAIKPTPIKQTALPSEYPLTDEMRVWARMETPDLGDRIDSEHKKFCNHYRSKGERRADWRPAWETWMIRAVEDFAPKQQKGSTNGSHYQSADERKADTYAQWAAVIRAGQQADDDPDAERRQGLRLIG